VLEAIPELVTPSFVGAVAACDAAVAERLLKRYPADAKVSRRAAPARV
jgi:hypothetical protein